MTTFQRAARHTLMAAALLCMGVQSLAQAGPKPAPAAATEAAKPQPAVPQKSAMDADLLYEVLVGEMAFRAQDAVNAVAHLLNAARRTRDEQLYQRAADMAVAARSGALALQVIAAWRADQPQSMPAREYELRTLLMLGRVAQTATPVVQYVRALPAADRTPFLLGLPVLYQRTPDPAVALDTLNQITTRVARNHPNLAPAAWTSMGRLHLFQNRPGQALQWAERAQRAAPKSEHPVRLALQVLADAEQLGPEGQQRTKAVIDRYLAQSKVSTEVLAQYARQLVNEKQPEAARTQLDRAIAQSPQDPAAWLLRGALLADQDQLQEAEADLERFLQLLPDEPENKDLDESGRDHALSMLARMAASRGDWAASERWQSAIQSNSRRFFVQLDRARLLAQEGQHEQALSTLRAAKSDDPDEQRRQLLLEAGILNDSKQHQAAYDLLSAALASSAEGPDNVGLMYETALSAERAGHPDEMERLLREIIRISPDNADAYNALGYSLADRNERLDEARQLIDKAIELEPELGYILDSLGWVQYRQGQTEQARGTLEKAFERQQDAEIATHLGEVLWVLGEHDEARRMWQRAMELDARNEVLRKTLERLGVSL